MVAYKGVSLDLSASTTSMYVVPAGDSNSYGLPTSSLSTVKRGKTASESMYFKR